MTVANFNTPKRKPRGGSLQEPTSTTWRVCPQCGGEFRPKAATETRCARCTDVMSRMGIGGRLS